MKKKLKAACALFIAFTAFSVTFDGGATAKAGNMSVVIEDGSVYNGDELSGGDWLFTKNSGITLDNQNSAIRFDTGATGKLFTSYTSAVYSEEADDNLTAKFDISLDGVLNGGVFGFLFGSPKLKCKVEDGGTFLYFGKDEQGFFYGLDVYGGSAEKRSLMQKTRLEDNEASVSITVSGKKRISLTVNGAIVYESQKDGEVDPDGFVGFA